MPHQSPIGQPQNDHEIEQYAQIARVSFGLSLEDAHIFIRRAGNENIRLLCEDGAVSGGLIVLKCGQWFGGRCVPTAAIVAVATAPHRRGFGVASKLMNAMLREMRDDSVPISTLYPATVAYYRKLGYGLAGGRFQVRLPASALPHPDRALPIRPMVEEDADRIERFYDQWAQWNHGNLRRHSYHWARVRSPRGKDARGFVIERDGNIEGYLYCLQERPEDAHDVTLKVTDFAATTPQASRRILDFLADHRSMVAEVILHTGPADPLLTLLPETAYALRLELYWMVRVINVAKALEARGYPAGLEAELHLQIDDQSLGANSGRYVLTVSDAAGQVRPGGDGLLRMSQRALATMYAAHLSPHALHAVGLLHGDPDQLAAAQSVFAAPAPWMRDQF